MEFSRQEYWSGLQFPSPIHESEKWKWSRSVVFNSLQPHGLWPTRPLRPWHFPGKSTGVGCHCLLEWVPFPHRDLTRFLASPALVNRFLTTRVTWKALLKNSFTNEIVDYMNFWSVYYGRRTGQIKLKSRNWWDKINLTHLWRSWVDIYILVS